jgi:hypothetical protein
MELFRIGGPNPDTNYLFMGKSSAKYAIPHVPQNSTKILPQATMSIEATTQLRPSPSSLLSKSDTPNASPSSVATTSPARSRKCMAFTTSAYVNMAMPTYGNTSPIYSITSPSPPSSTTKSSASTEVSPPVSTPSITSGRSTAYKRSHTKVPCAISSGLTQMIDVGGVYLLEEQGIRSVRTSQRPLIITTD